MGRDPSHIPSALLDQPVPQFALPGVEGREGPDGFDTADLEGSLSIVNVFASWCVPCLAEHPLISGLAEDGYRIYGINHRDKDAEAAAWLNRHGDPYTGVGADRDARVSVDWGVTGVPETFIGRWQWRDPLQACRSVDPSVASEEEFVPRLRALGG